MVALADRFDEVHFPESIRRIVKADIEANGKLAAWRWYCRYLRYAIESLLWIQTQEGELIPVRLNNIQRRALAYISWQLIHDRPVRMIWMKSRRMGVSTFISALFFILTRYQRNRSSLIMANNADATQMIFGMHRLFDEQLASRFGKEHPVHSLPRNASNMKLMSWHDYSPDMAVFVKEGGSRIRIVTGLSSKGAAGDAFQCIHYSEIGDDRVDWESQTKANDRCVKLNLPRSIIIREGTTYLDDATKRPMTGIFLQQSWDKARSGESAYTPWFDAWWEFDQYRIPLEPGETIPDFGGTLKVQTKDREEVGKLRELICEKWRVSSLPEPWRTKRLRDLDEALKWRLAMLKEMEGSFEWFHSQYPSYPEQAFVTRGRSYFAVEEINSRIEYNLKNPTPSRTEGDRLTIYHDPEPGTDYLITADGATERGEDNAGAVVLNTKELRDDAIWHGKTTPAVQAEEWSALGWRYATRTKDPITGRLDVVRPALLVPESNNVGMEIVRILRDDLKYPNLWIRRNIDKRRRMTGGTMYGFDSGEPMRTQAITQLSLQWQSWRIPDNRVLRQMAAFGWGRNGKLQAVGPGGDEFVSCYWMRAFVCEMQKWVSKTDWADLWVEPEPTEDPAIASGDIIEYLHVELAAARKDAADGKFGASAKADEIESRIRAVLRRRRSDVSRNDSYRRSSSPRSTGDWRLRGLHTGRSIRPPEECMVR